MKGQEYTLSKFAGYSELEGVIDTSVTCGSFRPLDRLWKGIDLDLRIL